MDDIVSEEHKQLSRELKRLVSVYKESRDLVLMGGYSKGQDKSIDKAHEMWPKIVDFMKQDNSENDTFEGSLQKLKTLLEKLGKCLIKKVKNLSLIKQKKLLGQKLEITTLDNEFTKNKSNKEKLKDILSNTSINSTELAWNIKEKSQYKLKLIEQIYISENREKFLSIEMKRAKTNLGKLIKEKEVVDNKIKLYSVRKK